MKRYWIFAGECYYAVGGMADFVDSFETVEEAIAKAKSLEADSKYPHYVEWWHLFDSVSFSILARGKDTPHGFDKFPQFVGEETK